LGECRKGREQSGDYIPQFTLLAPGVSAQNDGVETLELSLLVEVFGVVKKILSLF
jgi:hypothetical protein